MAWDNKKAHQLGMRNITFVLRLLYIKQEVTRHYSLFGKTKNK